MSRFRLLLIVALAVVGAALSTVLLLDHHGVRAATSAADELCGPDHAGGCDEVSRSPYSSVFGVSLGSVGLLFYASILLLLALGLVAPAGVGGLASGMALLLFGLALLVDLVLLGIQAFAIGAFCRLCIATYVVNLAALVILLPGLKGLGSFGADGRRALAVWATFSFLIALGLFAVDRALASETSEARVSLLGEPASTSTVPEAEPSAPEPEPAAEPDPPEPPPEAAPDPVAENTAETRVTELSAELELARGRIRELQATLDDPQKYQDYQAEKAARDFERETPQELALDGIPFKGPASAPVRVVEFSDFLCPFCRNLAGAFQNYMPQSGGRVAIYYKNYPLDQACNSALSRTIHDGACELALGAICAHEQQKFWPYHDRVFSQPPQSPSDDDVVRIAGEAGLDTGQMRACLQSSAARDKLTAEIGEAQRLAITSTPTVFVNGKRLQQIGGFLPAVESELKRLGLESPQD